MLVDTYDSTIVNNGKDLKISKNSFNRHDRQAGSRAGEKNISTIWIVE